MSQRLCRVCSQWHSLDEPWPVACVKTQPDRRAVRGIAIPHFISDQMDATEHVDGRFYTSKSEYRKVTKANGLVEIGNDSSRLKAPPKAKIDRRQLRDVVERGQSMAAQGWRHPKAI